MLHWHGARDGCSNHYHFAYLWITVDFFPKVQTFKRAVKSSTANLLLHTHAKFDLIKMDRCETVLKYFLFAQR